jgi:hypothetical protein
MSARRVGDRPGRNGGSADKDPRNAKTANLVREVVGPEEAAEQAEPALKATREASERLFRDRRPGGSS